MFSLKGKVAVVTGSSRGIGRATAEAFALAGAKVVVSSRDLKACQEVVQSIESAGGEAVAIVCDTGIVENCEGLAEKALEIYGKVDILVGNAATVTFTLLEAVPLEEYQHTMDVSTRGNLVLVQKLLPQMKARNDGVIIFITSTGGMVGAYGAGAYSMSKAATMSLVRTLGVECGRDNVRLNAIAPGLIATEMGRLVSDNPVLLKKVEAATPLGRMGRPEEIAAFALCLASEAGTYVTGQTFVVDGGQMMAGSIIE